MLILFPPMFLPNKEYMLAAILKEELAERENNFYIILIYPFDWNKCCRDNIEITKCDHDNANMRSKGC